MNVIIISIGHPFQVLEEAEDAEGLRASKIRLRELLQVQFAARPVAEIFEESSPRKESVAAQLAGLHDPPIPSHNIHMTEAERRATGIYDALLSRPGRPDDAMEYTIEKRIPADEVREDYFAVRILTAAKARRDVLVLLGDMHAEPVANRLRAKGHTVVIRSELVPIKRWE